MTDRKSPELDLLVLCSYVGYDGQSQPFSLNEPLHTVLTPADGTGKLPAPEFALYVQMTDEDAHGTYDFTVEVRTDTNTVIRHVAVEPVRVTFVRRYYPVRPFEHVFRIRDLVFDAPGGLSFPCDVRPRLDERPAARHAAGQAPGRPGRGRRRCAVTDPKPEPRRWTRVSNPVTPTVVTFPGGDSATAKPFVRLSNPVTPTVVTFARAPVLFLTLRGGREADTHYLPMIAALLIHEVSRLEVSHGGRGLEFDREGSVEEPGRLVLRLYPRLIDGEAAGRVRRVADELTRLARESRADQERSPDADLRTRIPDLAKTELARAISGVVDLSVEVAA